MREFPGKRRKTFRLETLTTKLLKKWMSKRTHGVTLSRTVRKPNERRDRRFGLKRVCWRMVDILNIGWNANCDTNATYSHSTSYVYISLWLTSLFILEHCLTVNNVSCCSCYTGESCVEVKIEADGNDITECSHDVKPTIGMFCSLRSTYGVFCQFIPQTLVDQGLCQSLQYKDAVCDLWWLTCTNKDLPIN